MMARPGLFGVLIWLLSPLGAQGQSDNLGLANGYITINTANFHARIVRDAQVLAALTPATGSSSSFDFLPFDKLSVRANNGQYHWGDVTFRYRQQGSSEWIDGDSAAARKPVTAVASSSSAALATSNLGPTLRSGLPLNITREWLNVDGDLGLRFTVMNTGTSTLELGSFGFPAEFNSIFTNRAATDIQRLCSLSDPYVGMDAGYIRANPVSGVGPALVVTPLNGTGTPFEAYRNLAETSYASTYYGSQTFEGFYEWQILTKAWAEKEWAGVVPWNPPSSRTLAPGEAARFGLRFSLSQTGVRGLDDTVAGTGTPVAVGVPGYIIPRGSPARLFLRASSGVSSISSEPSGALSVKEVSTGEYTVTPSSTTWGRVRLTVVYADGKTQTIHYHVTKAGSETIGDLGTFLTTKQWFNDTSDPFGRANSVMTYDYEAGAIVSQDPRVWIAGLSDEGGAGAFLAAMAKQAVQPNAAEVAKLETFVDDVLWGTIQQTSDYGVRKSIFYYDKSALPNYPYRSTFNWGSWTSWNKASAYALDRAYDYVHVAAAYWSMYRVARAYPGLVKSHTWDWYLKQAHGTVIRAMKSDVGYNRVGLMGETVFGEILTDLTREGKTSEAEALSAAMKSRATQWNSEAVPYGSEMAWDSTGQEGVYYWTKYFGYTNTTTKTVNSVLGYMPTVPHWGWNGNARRYWDNLYGGKLQRIERQIHHYGSGLNALVLLSAFRSDPSDWYLLQVGYGGTSGPLSNINQDGFAAASYHSWPSTLKWDGYSGDYGPGFLGLVLGSGTYVAQHETLGLLVYGGTLTSNTGGVAKVTTQGPVRRKVFIGPLGLLLTIDAGSIDGFSYTSDKSTVTLTLAQITGGPSADSAVLWIETTSGSAKYMVSSPTATQSRQGWAIKLSSSAVTVQLKKA